MQEKIVETKICKHCNSIFEITDKDLEFYDKISPIFAGEKYNIPTPNLCPECRQQRRLSFRNERKLYKRKCDVTGENIISIYSPDKKYKVYNSDYWWSDKWDAMNYGRDFDFNKGFFEQINDLLLNVPIQSLNNKFIENSPYVNECISCKNCYFIFNSIHSEDSLYSYILRDSQNCLDTGYCDKCFNSYEVLECGGNSHNLFFSLKSSKCKNSYFLYNCIKCEDCIGCSNLVEKKYYIFNEEYSQKDFLFKKQELFSLGLDFIKTEFELIVKNSFRRHMIGYANEDAYGDNLYFSKNCYECYDSNHIEDCKYVYSSMEITNCYDIYLFGKNVELSYDSTAIGENSMKILFSISCNVDCYNLIYCINCSNNCKNLFGCIGLTNSQYCIFNKQYSKEQYEILVPQIIEHMKKSGEWGEFFPSNISPFGYNESVAMEYFPITPPIPNHENSPHPNPLPRGEGIIRGTIKNNKFIPLPLGEVRGGQGVFNRSDYQSPFPKVEKIISANKLSSNINDIPDDILNWAVECEITKKPFKIIKLELDFYRKHNLPIPKRHPDQRHLDRMKMRNPRKLYNRKCDKCGIEIKTTYAPERKEIVYCEDCYKKAVY